jgi:hypothetical protein
MTRVPRDKGANASERTWVYNGPRSNRPRDFFAARVRDDGLWWRESLAYLQKNLLSAGAYKRGRRNIYTQNKGSMSVGGHRTQATSKEEHITPFTLPPSRSGNIPAQATAFEVTGVLPESVV